ncbi:hypothetical protein [Streptomyces sp. NPDC059171]
MNCTVAASTAAVVWARPGNRTSSTRAAAMSRSFFTGCALLGSTGGWCG